MEEPFHVHPLHSIMYSSYNQTDLPIRLAEEEEGRNYRRHHSARYYAHWVKESLTTRIFKLICTIFLFALFVAGLIAFLLYLSLRPHRPRFFIEDFQISGSDQPNGFQNAAAIYNVTIRNSNRKIVVHFDSIYGTVYYGDQSLGGAPMWTDPFDQQAKNSTTLSGSIGGVTMTTTTIGWGEFLNDRTAGSVVFRLEITSVIKFEIYAYDTKRHKMHAKCDVAVGSNGFILDSNKGKRCPVYFT